LATQQATSDRAVQASLAVLQRLVGGYRPRDFAVRFWDGSSWDPDPGQPARFTLVLQHPGALRKMFWPPNDLSLAEAYVYDDFDIEGDILAFFSLIKYLIAQERGWLEKLRLGLRLYGLPSEGRPRTGYQAANLSGARRSRARDRQAISYHYDLSNEFFALWLDANMLYSCAYFASPGDDLDTAQTRKIDYICRKLRLRPGERLLDIGCGWGGLVIHAARHYGVQAVGVTLSRRQVELANDRIRQADLQDRCRVEWRDYRDLDEPEAYDKLACVGMVEHLGEAMLPTFFGTAWRLLRPGGVFLNHGITLRASTGYPRWTKFARRYVFPDGEVRPVGSTVRAAEAVGFEVRDVESLREHYALTLQQWINRLEARHEEVSRATSEATYRVFRLYMAGAKFGYLAGAYNLHQTLLAKPDQGVTGLPLTRADWYA